MGQSDHIDRARNIHVGIALNQRDLFDRRRIDAG